MNKTFKKALAAFLAVLMVAFSVPFTALAADPVDTGAKIHVYAVPYDGKGAFLGLNNQASDNGEVKFYDLKNMSVAEVKEDAAYSRDKDTAMFALVFSVEGTNIDRFSWIADYDGTAIKPAYWRTNAAINKDDDGSQYAPKASENLYVDGMLDVMGTTSKFEEDGIAKSAMYLSVVDSAHDCAATTDLVDENNTGNVIGSIQGELCAVLGFELLKDCDLTQVIKTRMTSDVTLVDIGGKVDAVYGGVDWRSGNPTTGYFSIPELGLAPSGDPTPSKDTYTYTFADGSQQTVEVDAGAAPTAPDNTAAVTAHVADTETHKTTTYAWTADGDKAFKEVGTDTTVDCTFTETTAAVTPVHTKDTLTDGKTAVETCTACGFAKGGEVITAAHSYVKTEVAATCTVKAHDHYECACGAAYDDNFTGELAAHDWKATGNTRGDATCVTPGEVEFACSVCNETKWESGAYGAHQLTAHAEVPADCVTAGTEAYWTCDVCNKMFSDAEAATEITEVQAIPALNHSFTNYVNNNDATCQKNATETAKCDRCDVTDTREIANSTVAHQFTVAGETTPGTCVDKAQTVMSCAFGCGQTEIAYGDVDPANHKSVEVKADTAVAPTRETDGKEADKVCTACGVKVEEGAVIPALGVNITVQSSSLGTAAINGEDIANATKNVKYASAYTLTATPAENAEFVGWMVGNKIVSADATYTTNAYADMTYTPVFASTDSADFTVTFVDSYGNVVTTIASSELAALAELPEAPAFAGLTFTGWDMTLDEVKALTASATVTAKYDNDTATQYTVTATGCTITVDGVDYTDTASVTYNTLVTVKAENATAWTVNGSATPAAYGAEYSFYCGSDITVAPVTDAVTATPAVKAVSMEKTATHKVTFLATRSIPEGFTLVESGFVYGKGMAAEDLVLENVGKVAGSANGTVKQIVCNNKAADGQFSLSYGVKAMDASASAAAYVIYRQGNQSVVIYADAMIYNY